MANDRSIQLAQEIDRLRAALNAIIQTPRYQGIYECHRIAREALAGVSVEIKNPEKSLGDPFYYARVLKCLHERWERRCAYCHTLTGPFQIDHVKPVSRGGSDEIRNLVLSCIPCNQKKGTQTAVEFGYEDVAACVTTM